MNANQFNNKYTNSSKDTTEDRNNPNSTNTNQNKKRAKRKRLRDADDDDEDDDDDDDGEDSTSEEDHSSDNDSSDNELLNLSHTLALGTNVDDFRRFVQLTTSRAYGYRFDKYLTGKRNGDMIVGAWHSTLFVCSALVITATLLLRYRFGDYMRMFVDNLSAHATYRTFTHDPVVHADFFFDDNVNNLCEFLITMNVLYCMSTAVYASYLRHRSPVTVPATCVFTSLLVLVEITYVHVFYDVDHFIDKEQEIVTQLQRRLHTDYAVHGEDAFSTAYDHMAIWLKCCGIAGVFDFSNSSLVYNGDTHMQIPPVCCKREIYEAGVDKVLQCTKVMRQADIYTTGCMDEYTEWIRELCFYYDIYVWLHVVDCVVHAAIYKNRINLIKRVLSNTFD